MLPVLCAFFLLFLTVFQGRHYYANYITCLQKARPVSLALNIYILIEEYCKTHIQARIQELLFSAEVGGNLEESATASGRVLKKWDVIRKGRPCFYDCKRKLDQTSRERNLMGNLKGPGGSEVFLHLSQGCGQRWTKPTAVGKRCPEEAASKWENAPSAT